MLMRCRMWLLWMQLLWMRVRLLVLWLWPWWLLLWFSSKRHPQGISLDSSRSSGTSPFHIPRLILLRSYVSPCTVCRHVRNVILDTFGTRWFLMDYGNSLLPSNDDIGSRKVLSIIFLRECWINVGIILGDCRRCYYWNMWYLIFMIYFFYQPYTSHYCSNCHRCVTKSSNW